MASYIYPQTCAPYALSTPVLSEPLEGCSALRSWPAFPSTVEKNSMAPQRAEPVYRLCIVFDKGQFYGVRVTACFACDGYGNYLHMHVREWSGNHEESIYPPSCSVDKVREVCSRIMESCDDVTCPPVLYESSIQDIVAFFRTELL